MPLHTLDRLIKTRVRGESHGISAVDPASIHPWKQASAYSGNAAYSVDTKHMLRRRSWKT